MSFLLESQAVQHFIHYIQRHLSGRAGLPGVGEGHGRAERLTAQAAHCTQRTHAHGDDGRFGMLLCHLCCGGQQFEDVRRRARHHSQFGQVGSGLLLVVGAALIALGANLLVDNGTLIAQAMGVPESVIALTFVALGTSLPELVTAITSLMKGHSDLSLGNVVGANVFNLVLVSGMSVTLAPFEIPQSATLFGINSSLVLELPVMLLVMALLTIPALVRGKLSRVQGVALLCIYAAFCAVQFTM